MSENIHRLRKYRSKKLKAKSLNQFDRLSILYWRYHRKVYGPVKEIMLYEAHNMQVFF